MTQTSKEERERWRQKNARGLCTERLTDYMAPSLTVDELARLLADADRCAELEEDLKDCPDCETTEQLKADADALRVRCAELEPAVEELRAKLQSLTSVPYGSDLLLVRPLQCKYSGSWTRASEQKPVRVSLSMVGVNARDDTLYVRWPADAGYAEQSIYGWPLSELEPGGALRELEDDDQDEP